MRTKLEVQWRLFTVSPWGVWMECIFSHVVGRGGDKFRGAVSVVDSVNMRWVGCIFHLYRGGNASLCDFTALMICFHRTPKATSSLRKRVNLVEGVVCVFVSTSERSLCFSLKCSV